MKIKIEKTITYFKQASTLVDVPAEFQKNEETIMDYIESKAKEINSELNNSLDECSILGFSDETDEITFYESGLIVPSARNPLE